MKKIITLLAFAFSFSFLHAQNVGIGTNAPAQKLDVYGNMSMNSRLAFSDLADGWLRLNQSGAYTNGVYTPGFFRADGGIASGGVGSLGGGTINATGVINSAVGFQYSGAAVAGNYLRGNGTNFVSSAIQPADLSLGISGTANTIPKFTGTNTIGNSVITDDGSGHVVFNPSVYTYFNTGTVYANNNIIARGGVSNDGGTLALTASNSIVNLPNGYLYIGGSNAVQGTDSWLRLNNSGSFGSGIYSPGFLRVDGGFASGGIGGLGGGTIHASGLIRGAGFQDYSTGNQVIDAGGGWHRSYGQAGWYNGTYATGWYSTTGGEVATYNNSYIRVTGGSIGGGNLRFDAANPYIVSSSYYVCPGGAYFNSGTVYTEAQYQCRGGIHSDAAGDLTIAGGTNGTTYFGGPISGMSGNFPPNYEVRLTPNLHLNSGAGYAVILNWDNGTTGTSQALRIGNGASVDAFIVQANGNTGISTTTPGNNKLYAYQPAGGAGSFYGSGTVNAVYGAGAASTGAYTFGVTGYDIGSSARSGGTHGAYSSVTWGTLGYVNSGGSIYGLYYTSAGSGAGYLPTTGAAGIGAGGYGDFVGSWTRGDVIGSISAGELMASYNQGNEYTSGHQADIVTVDGKRSVAYSSTSPDVQVSKAGVGNLINGKATVTFDENYAGMLDRSSRPVVTISPIGNCNGIHIVSMSSTGFVIEENNAGTSNVEFTYIVIGKRADAASATAPADIMQAQFDENLKGVMFNEANAEQSAKPMWWDGSKVRFDAVPEEFRKKAEFKTTDAGAKAEEVNQLIRSSAAKQKETPHDPKAPTLEKHPVLPIIKAGYGNNPAMPGQQSDATQSKK
ncbi:MAG: Protein of unknown function precursor [Bacteroidetes bacterium]|nr:Protein of unknown function precursor [Bacteroidota bacterium]